MAEDNPPSHAGASSIGPRKRPGATIDLTATEIPTSSSATAASHTPEPDPSHGEPRPDAQPALGTSSEMPGDSMASPTATPAPDTLPPNAPPHADDAPFSDTSRSDAPPPAPPNDPPWRAYVAGAAGGAGVALILLLAWSMIPAGETRPASDPRLAMMEEQLRALATRAPTLSTDTKTLTDSLTNARAAMDALGARLAKLESAAPARASADPESAKRIAALEGQLKSVNDTIATIAKRGDASAAALGQLQDVARGNASDHSQFESLSNRVATLEKTDHAVADELAKRATAAAEDRSVRLALAANLLRAAVERSEPFQSELMAIRPLGPDGSALSALEPFAESGVPSTATLGRELGLLIPAMSKLAGSANRDGGFIDRLQANAEKLVRVRPVDETPGDSPSAILSRVEIRAAHGEIAGARAELAKLPERVRDPAKAWITRAEARARALDASRRLSADSVAALKPSR